MASAALAAPHRPRLAVNYLLLTGGELAGKVATFTAFVYLARVLGPGTYGNLEFVLAAMVFFTLPVDFGLGTYGSRELARDRSRAADLLREVAALRLTLACTSFTVLLGLAALLPQPAEVRWLLVVCGLTLFAEPALVLWFFQGHDRMHWVALASLIRRVVFAGLALAIARPDLPLPWIGAFECAAAAVTVGFCLVVLHRRLGYSFALPVVRLGVLWRHLGHAAPIGLSELAWAFLWYFATVLMGLLAAGEELGWFAVAHRFAMAAHTFVWLYFYNLLPTLTRAAAGPPDPLRALLHRSLALTTCGGVLVAVVSTLMAEPIVRTVYGSDYAGAAGPLKVLMWVIPVALVSGHYRYLLIATGRQRLECLCTMVSAISAIGLAIAFVPGFGAMGGAAALLVASVVNLIMAYGMARWVPNASS